MGKKLELMWNVGKNLPVALYETACAVSIVGGALALPVAGAFYLSGEHETAKQIAGIGAMGICGGTLASFFRCIDIISIGLMPDIEYKVDLMAQQSFAFERIINSVQDYNKEKTKNSLK